MSTQKDILSLFELVPELRPKKQSIIAVPPPISPTLLERLENMIWDRLWLIQEKLRLSKYHPLQGDDPFKVNTTFSSALIKWLKQWPDDARLGALLLALSVEYFPEQEMTNFLESCAQQFRLLRSSSHFIPRLASNLYPLTQNTSVHTDFTHLLGSSISVEKPRAHGENLERLNWDNVLVVSAAARGQDMGAAHTDEVSGYPTLANSMRSLLDKDCIIIEDWSLSGTTATTAIEYLLRTLRIIFGRHTWPIFENAGYRAPSLTIVFPITTQMAVAQLQHTMQEFTSLPFELQVTEIYGHVFPDTHRVVSSPNSNNLPTWMQRVNLLVNGLNLNKALKRTFSAFDRLAGKECRDYFEKHKYPSGTDVNELVKYGYGPGGWVFVAHSNCPNNSLPLLWFDDCDEYRPLFPRVESKHSSFDPAIEDGLLTAETPRPILQAELLRVARAIVRRRMHT